MICTTVAAIQIYYNLKLQECIENPLVYAAKDFEERFGFPFQGSGTFIIEGGSPYIIHFNSEKIDVERMNNDPTKARLHLNYGD